MPLANYEYATMSGVGGNTTRRADPCNCAGIHSHASYATTLQRMGDGRSTLPTPYVIRRHPIAARAHYQALRIINRDAIQIEYGIGVSNLHFRTPMRNIYGPHQNVRKR